MGTGSEVAAAAGIFGMIKEGWEAVDKTAEEVRSVVEALNQARSCVITIGNNTSNNLELTGSDHEHGAFSTSPPGLIKPRETGLFSSQSRAGSIATGTEGFITYRCNGVSFRAEWNNPFIGENSSSCSVEGPFRTRFRAVATTGGGNEHAPMRYDLFELKDELFRVAARPQDKWVLTMGNRILVIVDEGQVFAHAISDAVGPAFRLS